jgi:hypothetical protein
VISIFQETIHNNRININKMILTNNNTTTTITTNRIDYNEHQQQQQQQQQRRQLCSSGNTIYNKMIQAKMNAKNRKEDAYNPNNNNHNIGISTTSRYHTNDESAVISQHQRERQRQMEIMKLIAIRRSLQVSTQSSTSTNKYSISASQQEQQQQSQSRRRERGREKYFHRHDDHDPSMKRQPRRASVALDPPASGGKANNHNNNFHHHNHHHHCTFEERVQMSRKRLLHHELRRIHRRTKLQRMMMTQQQQQQQPNTATKTDDDHTILLPSQLYTFIDNTLRYQRQSQQQNQQQQQQPIILGSQGSQANNQSTLLLRQRPDHSSHSVHHPTNNNRIKYHDDVDDNDQFDYDTDSLIKEANERMDVTRKFLTSWKMKHHASEEEDSRTTDEQEYEECCTTTWSNDDDDDEKRHTIQTNSVPSTTTKSIADSHRVVDCQDDNDVADEDRSRSGSTTISTLKGMQFYSEALAIDDDRPEEIQKRELVHVQHLQQEDNSSSLVTTKSTSNVLFMIPTSTTCPSDEMSQESHDKQTPSFPLPHRAVEKEMKSIISVNNSLEPDMPEVDKPTLSPNVSSSSSRRRSGKSGWTLFQKLAKSALRINQEGYPSTAMTSSVDQSSTSDAGVDVCGESTVVASNGVRRGVQDDTKKGRRGSSTGSILLCSKSKVAEEEWFVAKAREAQPAGRKDRVMEMVFFD